MASVDQTAVDNFLGTLEGLTYQEAVGNCEMDAASHGWSRETQAAIRVGLLAHFFPKPPPASPLAASAAALPQGKTDVLGAVDGILGRRPRG